LAASIEVGKRSCWKNTTTNIHRASQRLIGVGVSFGEIPLAIH